MIGWFFTVLMKFSACVYQTFVPALMFPEVKRPKGPTLTIITCYLQVRFVFNFFLLNESLWKCPTWMVPIMMNPFEY
jgi:hypothetical protein